MANPAGQHVLRKVGPWGGHGGHPWQFRLGDSRLTRMKIWKNQASVCSIQFTFLDEAGKHKVSGRFGGDGGDPEIVDFDGELVEISGTFGRGYPPHIVITSLSFKTKEKEYGPFGKKDGTNFVYAVEEGSTVAGFFGRYEDRLHNFGFIVKSPNEKVFGPSGGDGGAPWQFKLDDGSQLTGIKIWRNQASICSIQITYVDDAGEQKLSGRFGGDGGDPDIVIFDSKLVEISGTFGNFYPPSDVITSLSFKTVQKKHGPFGPGSENRGETSFVYAIEEGSTVSGFFGRYGDRLDSFGCTVKVG